MNDSRRSHRRAAALLAVAALLVSPAWAFRCGTHLITEGDTQEAVRAKCGEPSQVSRHTVLRPAIIWRYGRPYRVGNGDLDVAAETWIYNLGPNRFMRRLRFEDGIVVEIDTLGYGYY